MKKKIFVVIMILLILASIIYFILTRETKKNTTKKPVKNNTEEVIEKPVKTITIVNKNSNSRPYAVMINNHSIARAHHAGIQDAYITYEIIVEGGLTRMMAVFKDKDTNKIGSVRSSRHYFLDYALENDAIYVHFGWSPQAQSDIGTLGINNINGLYDSRAFYRDTTLRVPLEHTAFTTMSNLKEVAASKNYRTTTDKKTLLNYTTDEVNLSTIAGAIVANNVVIPYSGYVTTSYQYDSVNKVYLRSVNGVAHTDSITGNQYTTKNIITYKLANSNMDSYGRQNLGNIGSGEGYYITNGYAVPITWTKSSRDSQTVYKYQDGTEINVSDGNTFIQIEPSNQNLTIN